MKKYILISFLISVFNIQSFASSDSIKLNPMCFNSPSWNEIERFGAWSRCRDMKRLLEAMTTPEIYFSNNVCLYATNDERNSCGNYGVDWAPEVIPLKNINEHSYNLRFSGDLEECQVTKYYLELISTDRVRFFTTCTVITETERQEQNIDKVYKTFLRIRAIFN